MKLRLLALAMFTLLCVSCSKDEVTQPEEVNLITTLDSSSTQNSQQRTPCFISGCDENYVFPQVNAQVELIYVTYDDSIALEDIHCIRYEYFYCYDYLRMLRDGQPSDPRREIWSTPARPDDDLDVTICNDPRVGSDVCDD